MVCHAARGAVSPDNTSRRSSGVAVGSSRIYAIISRRFWSEAKFSEE
jgi:hypothetical protein